MIIPDSYHELIFNLGTPLMLDGVLLPRICLMRLQPKPIHLQVVRLIGVRLYAWTHLGKIPPFAAVDAAGYAAAADLIQDELEVLAIYPLAN